MGEYRLITLESIGSTNDYVKSHTELLEQEFTVVRAVEQTGGRGRFTRNWYSVAGLDLTFSFVFRPGRGLEDVSIITMLVGMALYRALKPFLGSGLNIKWPNDLYVHNRKIAGILCELVDKNNPRVIIGIGLNVNSLNHGSINIPATSMKVATGHDHDITVLLATIMAEMIPLFRESSAPLSQAFLDEWVAASSSIGSKISYVDDSGERNGIIVSVNPFGSLIIAETGTGREFAYRGEVIFED